MNAFNKIASIFERERVFGIAYISILKLSARLRGAFLKHFVFSRDSRGLLTVGGQFQFRSGRSIITAGPVKVGQACRFECFPDFAPEGAPARLTIGRNVNIGSNVHIGTCCGVRIASGVLMGSNILIVDHNHGHFKTDRRQPEKIPKNRPLVPKGDIIVEENVWLCDGVIILGGSTIKRGSIVPAGTIVSGVWSN